MPGCWPMTPEQLEALLTEALLPQADALKRSGLKTVKCEVKCSDDGILVRCSFDGTSPDDDAHLAYKEAITQLRSHPELIWTRNNFFLLVQGGLLAAVTKKDFLTPGLHRELAYAGGLLVAAVWLWVTWAGRELQREWRGVVKKLESRALGRVEGPFLLAAREGAAHKVSITAALLTLAGGFAALWLVVIGSALYQGCGASSVRTEGTGAVGGTRGTAVAAPAAHTGAGGEASPARPREIGTRPSAPVPRRDATSPPHGS